MAIPGSLDLNHLRVFAAVVDCGSFTAAAHWLGVAPAKVSTEIARLEAALDVTLFNRTTRRVVLTEAGARLHADCGPLLQQLLQSVERVRGADAPLTGTLRIAVTVEFGARSLAPALAGFLQHHPQLSVDVRASDHVSDLLAEGCDVAIRLGWLRDSTARAVKLGEFQQYAVASPDYIRRSGLPRDPAALAQLDWVTLTLLPSALTWTFRHALGQQATVQMHSRLRVDSQVILRGLIRAGGGATVLDQMSVDEDLREGRLVRLLPDWQLPAGGIYAVFPPGPHIAPKAQAFVEHFRAALSGGLSLSAEWPRAPSAT